MANVGLTVAVMSALDATDWRSYGAIIQRLAPQHHKAAGVIIVQKIAAGYVERRGLPRQYEYRRTSKQGGVRQPAKAMQLEIEPLEACVLYAPIFAASLGTRCRARGVAP